MTRPASHATLVVAGATGYVGSALVERLILQGRRVRCLVRNPDKLGDVRDTVEVVEADLHVRDALAEAFERDCVAYFLVHALAAGGPLIDEERALARDFADAARAAAARRIVYLGGLVDEDAADLSPHMESRVEIGRVLRNSGVQTVEFRASIVIGAGSFSFELIRQLVDHVPMIVLPGWVDNLAQRIALADVVSYLAAAEDADVNVDVVEIGGPEQISYRRLIELYADAIGARRATVLVPVPEVAAAAASQVTALMAGALPGEVQVTLKLLESLRHTTVVRAAGADRFDVRPMKVEEAVGAVLANSG